MKKLITSNKKLFYSEKHRAKCKTDRKWISDKWRSTIEKAQADLTAYKQLPGNSTHILTIITQQERSEGFFT